MGEIRYVEDDGRPVRPPMLHFSKAGTDDHVRWRAGHRNWVCDDCGIVVNVRTHTDPTTVHRCSRMDRDAETERLDQARARLYDEGLGGGWDK